MHAGYQLPITERFRVIPLVGYVSLGTKDLLRGPKKPEDRDIKDETWEEMKKKWERETAEEMRRWNEFGYFNGIDFGMPFAYNIGGGPISPTISPNITRFGIHLGCMLEFDFPR